MGLSLLANYIATEIAEVDYEATIFEAAHEMETRRIGSLLVKKEGEPTGIITESNIVRQIVAKGLDASITPVHDIMISPILSLDVYAMPHEAFLFMAEHEIRHVVITHEGEIIGMLSVRDLLHFFKDAADTKS